MKPIFKNYFKLSTMKEDRLDNIFRQELGQYDSGTPEHLWAGIEARRKKPNRRPAWLPLIGGLAAIFAVGLSGWLLYPDMISPDLNSEQEQLTVKQSALIADAISPTDDIKDETVEDIQETEIISNAFAENSSKENANVNSEAIPKSTPGKSSYLIEKPVLKSAETEAPIASSNENSSPVSASLKEAATSQITILPSLKSDLLAIDLGESLLKGPEGCYNFDGRSGGPTMQALSFDLIGGPGFAPRTLKNTGDTEQDGYLTAREDSERSWYAFSGQLRANMRYNGGLTFRVGIGYSQINEIFEFSNGSATRTITTEVTNSDGSTSTVTTVEEGELYKLTHNRLRFIDIPVTLGYEKQVGKFTFGVNAGAGFNLQFTQKGDFLDETGEPVTFTTDEPNKYDYFKTQAGISYLASAGISYQLTDHFDLHFEPHFRYFSKSLSESTLEQRYTNFGIQAGVRYYIFDKNR